MSAELAAVRLLTEGDVITDPTFPGRLCTVSNVIPLREDQVLVCTITGATFQMLDRPVLVWNRYEAHGVNVDEVGILNTRLGAQWWADFLLAHRHTNRIRTVYARVGRSVAFVACDTTLDAAWLVQHAQHMGVPASCLTPVTQAHRMRADEFVGLAEGPSVIVDDEPPRAGVCPACHRWTGLSSSAGLIRSHHDARVKDKRVVCAGQGQPPLDQEARSA